VIEFKVKTCATCADFLKNGGYCYHLHLHKHNCDGNDWKPAAWFTEIERLRGLLLNDKGCVPDGCDPLLVKDMEITRLKNIIEKNEHPASQCNHDYQEGVDTGEEELLDPKHSNQVVHIFTRVCTKCGEREPAMANEQQLDGERT
jgi:hypothetical protein